jgi:hypothetical protein
VRRKVCVPPPDSPLTPTREIKGQVNYRHGA